MASFGLVIFDCDGVLVDSESIANRYLQRALANVGIQFTMAEIYQHFVGLSMATCMGKIEAILGKPVPNTFLADLDRDTFAAFERELQPVNGITNLLEHLALPYCVASSGSHQKMAVTLNNTQLLRYFGERVFSAYDVERGKPYPDLFLHAAQQMGVAPEKCLLIEDAVPGVQAGVAANMTVIGFAERGQQADLLTAGASLVVTSHSQLLQWCRQQGVAFTNA